MGNDVLVAWWQAAWKPVQLLANWQEAFTATWAEVYSPSGAGLIKRQ